MKVCNHSKFDGWGVSRAVKRSDWLVSQTGIYIYVCIFRIHHFGFLIVPPSRPFISSFCCKLRMFVHVGFVGLRSKKSRNFLKLFVMSLVVQFFNYVMFIYKMFFHVCNFNVTVFLYVYFVMF